MLRRSTLLRCGERDCRRKVHKKLSLKQCLKLRNSFKTNHREKITTKDLFEFLLQITLDSMKVQSHAIKCLLRKSQIEKTVALKRYIFHPMLVEPKCA